MARLAVTFLLFVALYYLPFVMEPTPLIPTNLRVRGLLAELLQTPAIIRDLAVYATTHLALLAAVFAGCVLLARSTSKATGIRYGLVLASHLIAACVLMNLANAQWFPLSNYSITLSIPHPLLMMSISAAVLLAGLCILIARQPLRHTAPVLGVIAAVGVGMLVLPNATGTTSSEGRNIVIIGVDSLSRPLFDRMKPDLPALAALDDDAHRFINAHTPVGRTFPAWVSILSGASPADHGAVFNLRDLDVLKVAKLLPHDLQERGYQTIYAIDERRFSNLDERFGFDHIVGPKAGILDFIVQSANDTPLTNLLLQTGVARWVLPHSFINAAAHTNYDAALFVEQIASTLRPDAPTFLAVHFLAAHFPYRNRHAVRTFVNDNSLETDHMAALTGVDRQVALLIERLQHAGKLDNALVILLSDHGEAFGRRLHVRETADAEPHGRPSFGHGTSLLDEDQSRVLLSVIEYRNGQLLTTPTDDARFSSLLSVRDIVNHYLDEVPLTRLPLPACIPVETELRLRAASDLRYLDPDRIIEEAAKYYRVTQDGRMALREDRLMELILQKDVGIRCDDRITYWDEARAVFRSYVRRDDAWLRQEPDPAELEAAQRYRHSLYAIEVRP